MQAFTQLFLKFFFKYLILLFSFEKEGGQGDKGTDFSKLAQTMVKTKRIAYDKMRDKRIESII